MGAVRKVSPYRLTPVAIPENDLHEAVAKALDLLLLPPATWTTFPAGSVPLPPQFAAKLARLGLKRGWPDVLVLHGRLYGVELKRVGGILSRTRVARTRGGALRVLDGQVDVFDKLGKAGMKIAIAHSVPEVIEALRLWEIPMRRAA